MGIKMAQDDSVFFGVLELWLWLGVATGIKRAQDDSVFYGKRDTKQQAIVHCAWLFGRRKTRDCSTKCVTPSTTKSPASGEAQRL
jgi:hypothetical protein